MTVSIIVSINRRSCARRDEHSNQAPCLAARGEQPVQQPVQQHLLPRLNGLLHSVQTAELRLQTAQLRLLDH